MMNKQMLIFFQFLGFTYMLYKLLLAIRNAERENLQNNEKKLIEQYYDAYYEN